MSRFTHFFRIFFVTEKQTPQTFSLLECMSLWHFVVPFYDIGWAIIWNCCQRIELHWRGQGRATSGGGKGARREGKILLRTPTPILSPAQASTSILAGQLLQPSRREILNSIYSRDSLGVHTRIYPMQMWTDGKKCGAAAGAVWKIAERVTANAKYTTTFTTTPTN